MCKKRHFINPLPGVSILIKNGKGEILLCKRKLSVFKGGLLCLPCGYIEHDETYLDAAHREIREETGISVTVKSILNVYSNSYNGIHNTIVIALEAQYLSGNLEPGDDVDEVKWMNGMIINETEMAFIADWMLINDCVTGLIERRGKIVLTNSVLYKGKENEKIFGF